LRVLVTGGSGFIGIHLVNLLSQNGFEVLNFDKQRPIDNKRLDCWIQGNILNYTKLSGTFTHFKPEAVLHLAAVAKQDSKNLDEFKTNIDGTKNLLNILKSSNNTSKLILTSTQYVNTPGEAIPPDIDKCVPYGLYGLSKKQSEKMLLDMSDICNWAIVRPTAIWGPYHYGFSEGLLKQISRGTYLHPKKDEAIKGYGYVKNTVSQFLKILLGLDNGLHGKTLYLADANVRQRDWVDGLSVALIGKPTRKVPKSMISSLAWGGEILQQVLGHQMPIYRSRYKNLITSNPVPLSETKSLIGEVDISLKTAIEETIDWFNMRKSASEH
jgi:nucleoside-diphosphate-sugar epimerase